MIQSLKPANLAERSPLEDAWIEFIERFEPYHWYCTLTFKNNVSNARANKQFSRYIRRINEILFGKRYRDKGLGLPYVNARERQNRGTPHFHTLIGGDVYKLKRLSYMDLWYKGEGRKFNANGFARILPFDSLQGETIRAYISKYVVKGGEIDVNIPPYMYEKYGLKKSSNYSFKFLTSNSTLQL